MEKYISYEKLSKKEKRRLDSARRRTWGVCNPATRKRVSSKAYSRKRHRAGRKMFQPLCLFFIFLPVDCRLKNAQVQLSAEPLQHLNAGNTVSPLVQSR